jgi:hypothetical protein
MWQPRPRLGYHIYWLSYTQATLWLMLRCLGIKMKKPFLETTDIAEHQQES